jgi:hypothetical protein
MSASDLGRAVAGDFAILPLWDFMKKIEIASYYDIGSMIAMTQEFADNKRGVPLDDEDRTGIGKELERIKEHLVAVDMSHSIAQLDHIKYQLEHKKITNWNEAKAKFDSLNVAAFQELSKIFVGYIPAGRARYWNQAKPFGETVFNNFESARADVVSAGNCYAVEQWTACVFHLMRVVEKGLRAIARERRIKFIQGRPLEWNDWARIIRAIEAKAEEINKKWAMGPRKDKALEFYRGAIGELQAFKDEFRNYVMHDRAIYGNYEAARAYQRTGEFMRRLASKLSETASKAIKWTKE